MGAACCAGSTLAGGAAAASAGPSSLLDGTIWGLVSALPVTLYHFYPTVTIALTTFAALCAGALYWVLILLTPGTKSSLPGELTFQTAESDSPLPLPYLVRDDSDDRVQLSVVIPAYNEVDRLPGMLAETTGFLEKLRKSQVSLAPRTQANGSSSHHDKQNEVQAALQNPLSTYEILVVDDGSKDRTHSVALEFAKKNALPSGAEIRVIRLEVNRGKGGAVRHGVMHTRGTLILFADADGATKFADLTKLATSMSRIVAGTHDGRGEHGVVVGSRAHMVKSDAVVKRSFLRNFLMHGFHLFLSLLMRPPTLSALLPSRLRRITSTNTQLPTQPEIKDTQCGFKLLTRPTARLIFPNLHIDGWIFDVEILMLAQMASKLALEANPNLVAPACPASEKDASRSDEQYWVDLRRLPLPIAECAVDWKEVSGSKIDLLRDSIRMALDLLVIRFNYGTGRWASPPPAL